MSAAAALVVAKAGHADTPSTFADDYDQADGIELARWVAAGKATPNELLQEALRRQALVNPELNFLAENHADRASQQLSSSAPSGVFAGVPFLLKDLGVQLLGTRTSEGSALLKNHRATTNSELVKRFEQAGLVIFGKTNTPEFGMALTTEGRFLGDCKNPWHLAHSTGGSSGGSAAAVAAGVVPMAHATDGGGSIRVPANHCGVFGFKPSRGLTPGVAGPGMSVAHIVSRTVRDSAVMLDVTAGYEPGAPYWVQADNAGFLSATQRNPRQLKVALNLRNPAVAIDPDVVSAVENAAKLLESLGHIVEVADPDIDFAQLNHVQNVLMVSEVAAYFDYVAYTRGKPIEENELEPMSWMIWRSAKAYSAADYSAALHQMHDLGLKMGAFHQQWDVVLQPVTTTPAPRLGTIIYQAGDTLDTYTERFKRVAAFTHMYNMTGQPSMSVPLSMSAQGLPIGVMCSAAVGQDAMLLALAAQLERAAPWIDRRPATSAFSTKAS